MVAEPTVVVVDDDDAVRDSLQAMLEAEGFAVETFAAAADFLEGYRPASNSCLVIDVRMPGMDGIELLTKLATRVSSPPVIMMTGHGDVPMAVMAMKLGAVDFVEKPFAAAALVRSIRDALATCRPASTATHEIDGRLARLTGRERDVLEQLVVGRSNKEIALELGISPRTVEIHRARVMEKMQAQSLSHLVRMALAAGIDPGEA
ncbi:MAG TPA: response regulator FixJ [Geminicoccaceae bacterium]|nr:response regulator FixJ [Geminicoccaceae bacterium]